MGPEDVPVSYIGQVVLTTLEFLRYPVPLFLQTSSSMFFKIGPTHVPLSCVGQVVVPIVLFLSYGTLKQKKTP